MASSPRSAERVAAPLVIDAGPALALARINKLHLPRALFAEALLPHPVYAECLARPDRADAKAVADAVVQEWLARADVPGGNSPPTVAGLGAGEVAVIRLSLDRQAVALLDDKAARQAALHAGLRVLGVVGLLRLAKRHGLIRLLAADLDALVKSGYYLSPALIIDTLRAEGELRQAAEAGRSNRSV